MFKIRLIAHDKYTNCLQFNTYKEALEFIKTYISQFLNDDSVDMSSFLYLILNSDNKVVAQIAPNPNSNKMEDFFYTRYEGRGMVTGPLD